MVKKRNLFLHISHAISLGNPRSSFDALETIQPGRPKMAMEYYPGWFDHWSELHHTTPDLALTLNLEEIITYPGSFNIYMFHGGTSFGLLNGANVANGLSDNSGFQPGKIADKSKISIVRMVQWFQIQRAMIIQLL